MGLPPSWMRGNRFFVFEISQPRPTRTTAPTLGLCISPESIPVRICRSLAPPLPVFSGQPQHCRGDGSREYYLSKPFLLLRPPDSPEPFSYALQTFTRFLQPFITSWKTTSAGRGLFTELCLINLSHPARLRILSISVASHLAFLRSLRLGSLRNHKSPCQF